jgi:pyruvate dehydrogenase (quinone)
MNRKVADVIVRTLEQAGVRHCYGMAGNAPSRIAEAIFQSAIGWVSVRNEEAGAFAAAAEALATGHLTALAGSCAPGGLRYLNGLYDAQRRRAPVILIATQFTHGGAGFGCMQEVDVMALYRGCSVYCDTAFTPEQAVRKAVLACQAAMAGQGVAVLVVPIDVAMSNCHGEAVRRVHRGRPVTRPDDSEIACLVQALDGGGNIAIYGGRGCKDARDEVLQMAALLNAPLAYTASAKQFLIPDARHDVGMTGFLGTEAGQHAVLECDTLLVLGADFAWPQYDPGDATVIQIDADATQLGRHHPVALGYVGDIKATLGELLSKLRQRHDASFRERYVRRYRQAVQSMRDLAVPAADGRVPADYLTRLIDAFAGEDAYFAADDGMPAVLMYRLVTANGRRRLYASLLHGAMAGGLPTAIGLQRSQPGRQVIALCGASGLSMLLGELLTVVQADLPIKIAVYDNARCGYTEIAPQARPTAPGCADLTNPDFGKVAEAVGLWGRTVSRADELEEAIRAWLAQPGPALLNVRLCPVRLAMPPCAGSHAACGMAQYATRITLHGMQAADCEPTGEDFL